MYQTKENGTIQSLPYDKFLQQGAENLTEEELIAIILRTGTRGRGCSDACLQGFIRL